MYYIKKISENMNSNHDYTLYLHQCESMADTMQQHLGTLLYIS
jgi:hypothetical protein